jgi:Mo-dependent nitrogenase C-terminus
MAILTLRYALSGLFTPLSLYRAWLKRSQLLLRGLYFYILNQAFNDPNLAHWVCRLVPAQCPFERDVSVLGREFHIPAFCKLNPFYESLVALRFRALSYLSEDCGEDVMLYCQSTQEI